MKLSEHILINSKQMPAVLKPIQFILALIFVCIATACVNEDEPPARDERVVADVFDSGMEGWEGGFADLPVDGLDSYELEVALDALPGETGESGQAIRLQGHNRSDDLFMFLKKEISGLEPGGRYEVFFEVELASSYPENSVGIGGSPGGSVFLKAGAVNHEPVPEPVAEAQTTYHRMNIDKGNQSQDGADMYGLGTIGIEGDDFVYELISRDNRDRPQQVTADDEGNLWLIVGTDSGFEGLTVLYYREITVTLKRK
ncbi:hypothetical protein SAMN04488057_12329 [Cyclobacterium lianum]|uniref:Uncharacterized protein n=1 Tax=Cyclobacterium lianum TaxID=388280 RepID=A0A1M7QS29_9BACT|nr:hypothetical protein [Cyclobacterium lianum]SHN34544.1 hypothetical protein SAMN04488057_12329 [Cyclobacterium lianum]